MSYKKVLFRDRQELQAGDLNDSQDYARTAYDDLIIDTLTPLRRYAGLPVSASSSTAIDIAAGRLYDRGKAYSKEATETRDLFNDLAVATQRYVSVVVYGKTIQTNVEPRDFLVNLNDGTTEPQNVPLTEWRQAQIDYVSGTESANPVPPSVPSESLRIADVLLDSTQIVSITPTTANQIESLNDLNERTVQIQNVNNRQRSRIDGIQSNLMSMGRKQEGKVNKNAFREVLRRVARLGDLMDVPANAISFGGDWFLDDRESDFSPADYDAVVEEGVRFPVAATTTSSLSLFNAAAADIQQLASDAIIAKYTSVLGLRSPDWGSNQGSLQISQYTYTTWTIETRTRNRRRVRYGPLQEIYCTNAVQWDDGAYDPAKQIFSNAGESWQVPDPGVAERIANHEHVMHFRARQVWWDTVEETYNARVTHTQSVSGVNLAQTFSLGNTRYLTRVGVRFADLGPDGGVTMAITYADEGEPSMRDAIAQTTIAYANLSADAPVYFDFEPTLLEPQRRYAVVLITGGDHFVHTEPANDVLDGDLVYFQADQYYTQTDANGNPRSVSLDVQVAQFKNSRITTRFNDLSLNGGISNIDITYGNVTPGSTMVHWEFQVGGKWYRLPPSENVLQSTAAYATNLLNSEPSTLPLRCVMQGSRSLMPTVELGAGSKVRVDRPNKVAFKHYATDRTLATASTHIEVSVQVNGFDPTNHTVSCSLDDKTNTATLTPTSSRDVVLDPGSGRRRRIFTFTPATATTDYQIIIEGTRSSPTAVPFIVEHRFDHAT